MRQVTLAGLLAVEWVKLRRTPVKWLVFGLPVLFASLLVWYYSGRAVKPGTAAAVFEVFFETVTALALPVAVGLLAGLIVYQEEQAGGFSGFLGCRVSRSKLYMSKLLLLCGFAAAGLMLATGCLGIGLHVFTGIPVNWGVFGIAACMTFAAALPMLALHLWISFAWGMGTSVAVGGGGLLIAALMATSLGDKMWKYVLWGWPVHLFRVGSYALKPEQYNLETASRVAVEAAQGLGMSALAFIALLMGGTPMV